MPRKMSGSAISRMDELTVAISMPSVVLDSAIHLYRDPAPAAVSLVRGRDETDGTGAPPAKIVLTWRDPHHPNLVAIRQLNYAATCSRPRGTPSPPPLSLQPAKPRRSTASAPVTAAPLRGGFIRHGCRGHVAGAT